MAAKFNNLRTIAQTAVTDGVTPGLAVAAGEGGEVRFLQTFGHRRTDGPVLPAAPETVWDLASLTKALVTSVLAVQAVGRGLLGLDERAVETLPALAGPDEEAITVRRLLCHSAGFPAHRPFFERVLGPGGAHDETGREALVALAAREPRVYPAGTRSLYTDLGFIVLGALLERRLGGRLDELAAIHVLRPLGLERLGFLPVGTRSSAALMTDVAATERCPVRGRVIAGEVHDLNAYAMGGVAGHAGLFGDARSVSTLAAALCAAWRGQSPRSGMAPLVDRDPLRLFWSSAGVPGSTWRLGWDGPSGQGSLAGDLISRGAVGHLGFTGCSLWIDPERETFVLVLANRVHQVVRDDPRFRVLRRALNDAALEAIGYRPRATVLGRTGAGDFPQ